MKTNRNRRKIVISVLLMLLAAFLAAGCGQKAGKSSSRSVIIPSADGKRVLETENLILDISHLDLGYLMVRYTGTADQLFVQLVGPDQDEYKYFMGPSEAYVTLPLTAGDGEYYLCAYESAGNSQYTPLLAQMLDLQLSDPFGPYLCSNQYVNFTMDSQAVKFARELTADLNDDLEKVQEIYNWVIRTVEYDYDKAVNVSTGYLPDIDRTLETGKGICFDFASMMAAMFRSLGIPTKLNIGYLTDNVYHAWISVYLDEIGWVDDLIQFDGADWSLMDPTVASTSGSSEVVSLADDDANYIVRYVR